MAGLLGTSHARHDYPTQIAHARNGARSTVPAAAAAAAATPSYTMLILVSRRAGAVVFAARRSTLRPRAVPPS